MMYMANFKKGKEKNVKGVYLKENNVLILKAGRMKTEEDKMCILENIRSQCFLLIYIRVFL